MLRVQDARIRRLPFQQKIGAGLTKEQFARRVDGGTVRHVGFTESIQMIADAMGWKLDRVTDDIEPKMADADVASDLLSVQRGPGLRDRFSAAPATSAASRESGFGSRRISARPNRTNRC